MIFEIPHRISSDIHQNHGNFDRDCLIDGLVSVGRAGAGGLVLVYLITILVLSAFKSILITLVPALAGDQVCSVSINLLK